MSTIAYLLQLTIPPTIIFPSPMHIGRGAGQSRNSSFVDILQCRIPYYSFLMPGIGILVLGSYRLHCSRDSHRNCHSTTLHFTSAPGRGKSIELFFGGSVACLLDINA